MFMLFGILGEIMKDWNLEGLKVKGEYLGVEVTGLVTETRVLYGTGVCNSVVLDNDVVVCEGVERKAGNTVFIDREDIKEVLA